MENLPSLLPFHNIKKLKSNHNKSTSTLYFKIDYYIKYIYLYSILFYIILYYSIYYNYLAPNINEFIHS